jgi:hypothetical protein
VLSADHRAAGGAYGTVLFGSNQQWAPRFNGQPFPLEDVWSTSSYYMAVGPSPTGGTARNRDGDAWEFPDALHAVVGFSGGFMFAAGESGAMYQFDGIDWMPVVVPTSQTLRALTALVSRFGEPFRVYAAGDNGALLVLKGGVWSPAATPAGAESLNFVDIWAAAIDDVFAVASNSTAVVRYDDPYEVAGWTLQQTPASAPLLAVGGWRGDVYVASEAGELFRNQGGGWTMMVSPVSTPLRDIRGLAESLIVAVGDGGTIIQFDGISWTKSKVTFAGDFLAVWGNEDRALFSVGTDGAVFAHE